MSSCPDRLLSIINSCCSLWLFYLPDSGSSAQLRSYEESPLPLSVAVHRLHPQRGAANALHQSPFLRQYAHRLLNSGFRTAYLLLTDNARKLPIQMVPKRNRVDAAHSFQHAHQTSASPAR